MFSVMNSMAFAIEVAVSRNRFPPLMTLPLVLMMEASVMFFFSTSVKLLTGCLILVYFTNSPLWYTWSFTEMA